MSDAEVRAALEHEFRKLRFKTKARGVRLEDGRTAAEVEAERDKKELLDGSQ